jgi:hypothetical protein
MKNIGLISLFIICFFAGCKVSRKCFDQYLTPAFIQFNLSDLDTIVIRKYEPGNNFANLVDTTLLKYDTSFLRRSTAGDTTFVLLNLISRYEKHLLSKNDWRIFVPAKNLTVSFSAIDCPQTETDCYKCDCWNPINSFLQNNQRTTPQLRKIPGMGGNFYITYIR